MNALVDDIANHIVDLISVNKSPKILVRSLTEKTTKEIHQNLLDRGISSFIVKNREDISKNSSSEISKNSLVSIRNSFQNGWVVFIESHNIATLHDSILNATKSKLFFNSWPVEIAGEDPRFIGRDGLYTKFLHKKGVEENFIDDIEYIIRDFLKSTQHIDTQQVHNYLIDSVLHNVEIVSSGMLEQYHNYIFGIPTSTNHFVQDQKSIGKILTSISSAIRESSILGKAETEARNSRIADIASKSEISHQLLQTIIDDFVIFYLSDQDNFEGTIYLFARTYIYLIGKYTLNTVCKLDIENLAYIFDVDSSIDIYSLITKYIDKDTVGIFSDSKKHCVTQVDALVQLSTDIIVNSEYFEISDLKIKVFCKNALLFEKNCASNVEVQELVIANHNIKYKNRLKLSVRLYDQKDQMLAQDSVHLSVFGEQRPIVVFDENTFSEYKISELEDSNYEIVELKKPQKLVVGGLAPNSVTLDGDSRGVKSELNFHHLDSVIEPRNLPNDETELVLTFDNYVCELLYKVDLTVGEHGTFDLLLQNQIEIGSGKPVLHKYFSEKISSSDINLNQSSQEFLNKRKLTSYFEDIDNVETAFPIEFSLATDKISIPYKYSSLDGYSKDIYDAYVSARNDLIRANIQTSAKDLSNFNYPLYSFCPLFSAVSKLQYETLISTYLQRFEDIFSADEKIINKDILYNLDTVGVPCNQLPGNHTVRLLGPWHPLSVVNRYLLQKTMFESVDSNDMSTYEFKSCFDNLRYNGVLSTYPTLLGPDYRSSSLLDYQEDSGWICVLDEAFLQYLSSMEQCERGELYAEFRSKLGINISSDIQIENSIKKKVYEYLTAFTADRRLEILFENEYSFNSVLKAFVSLYSDAYLNKEIKFAIDRLVGGIHLYLSIDKEVYERSDEIRDVLPDNIYFYDITEKNRPERADINFQNHASVKISLKPQHKDFNHRGSDTKVFLSLPLTIVDVDASRSVSWEPISDHFSFAKDDYLKPLERISSLFSDKFQSSSYSKYTQFSLIGGEAASSNWIYIPAENLNIEYLIQETKKLSGFTLWEYKVDFFDSANDFYLLCNGEDISVSLNRYLPKAVVDDGRDMLRIMSENGLALSKEAQTTESRAKGAVGILAALELFDLSQIDDDSQISFLLPIDSFAAYFSSDTLSSQQLKHCDLILVQCTLSNILTISCTGIECKFRSNDTLNKAKAFEQARLTQKKMSKLIRQSKSNHAVLESVFLSKIIKFGFSLRRLQKGMKDSSFQLQNTILEKLATSAFTYSESRLEACLVYVCTDPYFKTGFDYYDSGKSCLVSINSGPTSQDWPSSNSSSITENVKSSLYANFVTQAPASVSTDSPLAEVPKEDPAVGQKKNEEGDHSSLSGTIENDETRGELAPAAQQKISDSRNLKCIIGNDIRDSSSLFYQVHNGTTRLANNNLMISGTSGKGKTQFIKGLMYQLNQQSIKTLVFDLKNRDYSGVKNRQFLELTGIEAIDAQYSGLPYNPLMPSLVTKDDGTKVYEVVSHIYSLVDALGTAYSLGVQQKSNLINAIQEAYYSRRIPDTPFVEFREGLEWPTMAEVGPRIKSLKKEELYGRLRQLFELRLFRDEYRNKSVSDLLKVSHSIDLSGNFSDDCRDAVALLTVSSLQSFLNAQSESSSIKYALFFDEAAKILTDKSVENLARKCRSYGLALVVSSQLTTDFPINISANLHTKLIHGVDRDRAGIKAIRNLLSLSESEDEQIAGLSNFDAYVSNSHYSPSVLIKTFTLPHILICKAIKHSDTGLSLEDIKSVEGLIKEEARFLVDDLIYRNIIIVRDERYLLSEYFLSIF